MKLKHLLIIPIIFLATFVRIYKITTLPPSLFYDEVDAGYQATTFNQNQTDYYGNKFPLHFHSFGDFRTSLHIYSIALAQKIPSDPNLSVRLPSAIYGILSVFIIYLLTKSAIPALLLAISPWAIHYNRIGFEVSGMLLLILLGLYFWQKFLKHKKIGNLYLTALFFCLTPYFYSTAKIFVFFIAILVSLIWWKTIINIGIKRFILPIFFAILLLSPIIIDTIIGQSSYRFSYISIFTMPHKEQIVDTLRYQDASTKHPNQIGLKTSLSSSIFHNKYQLILQKFISNYINSFSTSFLFLKGDNNLRHGFGNHGLLYLIDIIFVFVGISSHLFLGKKNKLSTLFFWLFVLAPIPFSLTRDSESAHATRLILMLPSFIYFSYLGITYFQSKCTNSIIIILFFYGLSFLNFWHYYYYHYPQESARVWNMGMEQAVISSNNYSQNTLVYSDDYSSFVSFFLYYHPYYLTHQDSIENHLKPINNNSFSGQVIDDKYYFGHVNWTNLSFFPENSIYILPTSEYKTNTFSDYQTLKIIQKKYENQEEFYLITKNEN